MTQLTCQVKLRQHVRRDVNIRWTYEPLLSWKKLASDQTWRKVRGASISQTTGFVQRSRGTVLKVHHEWTNGAVSMTQRANCVAPRTTDPRGGRRLRRLVRTARSAPVYELTVQIEQVGYQTYFQHGSVANPIAHGLPEQIPGACTLSERQSSQTTSSVCTAVLTLDPYRLETGCLLRWVMFSAPPSGRTLRIRRETSETKHLAIIVCQNKGWWWQRYDLGNDFLTLAGSAGDSGEHSQPICLPTYPLSRIRRTHQQRLPQDSALRWHR